MFANNFYVQVQTVTRGRPRPNRIYELTKARKWTYPEVAHRVRTLAEARRDESRAKCHTITINRLATGDANLTQEWMTILGEVFGVQPVEIIAQPIAENLLRVTVTCALEAGHYKKTAALSVAEQFDIMIPYQEQLNGAALYAGEIRGTDNNLRYTAGAIVVVSKLDAINGNRAREIVEGKRYHVRITRDDGMIEESIKQAALGPEGQIWLKPESSDPRHAVIPLIGRAGVTVEIIGRVRGVFLRED